MFYKNRIKNLQERLDDRDAIIDRLTKVIKPPLPKYKIGDIFWQTQRFIVGRLQETRMISHEVISVYWHESEFTNKYVTKDDHNRTHTLNEHRLESFKIRNKPKA